MFEVSFETLLNRALERVKTVDTSEGSLIYDAITPCIVELYELYLYCNELEKRVYADTAYEEYLDRRTSERGIFRKQAISSQRKAHFDNEVPINSKWGKEDLTYTVTSHLDGYDYLVTCNTVGSIGNKYSGELINIDAIPNITSAILGDIVIAGENIESDESLRTRYFTSFSSDAFGGNIADYKEKVLSIDGVGQVKVIPCWNGVGTVKLLILTTTNGIPDELLLKKVKDIIDPEDNEGLGYGLAPIGHTVTIESPETQEIRLSVNLEYEDGYDFTNVKSFIEDAVQDYFRELISSWSETNNIILRISHIESRILQVKGVKDLISVKVNEDTQNITLNDKIPILVRIEQ